MDPLSLLLGPPDPMAQARALRGEPEPQDQGQVDMGTLLMLAGGHKMLPGIGAGLVQRGNAAPGERLKQLLEQQKFQQEQGTMQAADTERQRRAGPVDPLGTRLLSMLGVGALPSGTTAGSVERYGPMLEKLAQAKIEKAKSAADAMPDLGPEWQPTRALSKKDQEEWATAMSGKEEFAQALQNYRDILKDGGTGGFVGPHAQELRDARNTVMLTYNKTHGINRAPQHEEMKMLESMVPGAADWSGVTTSLPTIEAALGQLEKSAQQNVAGVAKAKGIRFRGTAPPFASSASAVKAHPQDAAAVQWARDHITDPRAKQILQLNGGP